LQKILWSIKGIQFFSGGKKKFNVAIFTSFMFNNLIANLTYGKCFHIHLLLSHVWQLKMTDQACEKELVGLVPKIGWYLFVVN
jgi:hypothetical protein